MTRMPVVLNECAACSVFFGAPGSRVLCNTCAALIVVQWEADRVIYSAPPLDEPWWYAVADAIGAAGMRAVRRWFS